MTFRKPNRPNYYTWPTLPDFGRVGPWSTGTSNKRLADRMEAWLKESALTRPEIVEGIVEGSYTFRDAWVAKMRGQESLDRLVEKRRDAKLADAIARARKVVTDKRVLTGLDHLEEWVEDVEPGARVSWLDHRRINAFYAAMREKMSSGSIRRSPHRAVREVLSLELGGERADQRMRDVRKPAPAKRRDVDLTPDEVGRIVRSAPSDRFRWMVTVAILTTADRKPLLKLTPRHFDPEEGSLRVPDTKTENRARKVMLPEIGVAVLRLASAGRSPTERLFPWTPDQVRKRWDATREKAKLEHVRFKDLRHLLPTLLAAMKVDRREIQAIMGHAPGSRTTDRYIHPSGDVDTLNEAAKRLGFSHLEAS